MSVLDVKKYYDEVCEQRRLMIEEIKDFEAEAEKGLVEPERLDEIKETIQPLLNNYQTLSYIMFLLNKPVKKHKHERYRRQNTKLLKSIDPQFTKEGIIEQNNTVINNINRK